VPDLGWELPGNQRGITGKHRGQNVAGRLCHDQGADLGRRLRERGMM